MSHEVLVLILGVATGTIIAKALTSGLWQMFNSLEQSLEVDQSEKVEAKEVN